VLQVVDLATGEGLADAAAAQSAAEGVAGQEVVVARLAQSGLATDAATTAAAGQHWRELWVAAPVGDRLVEGYIDLLYRSAEGLVVVDWKTDQVGSPDELDAKVSRYRLQGASYAAALAAATGEPVARMTFVFLREDGATEVDLPDLSAAMDEVVRRAADLAELSAVDGLGGDADHG
jgi:ATP-dependent helicase/nuclease subunit A